MNKGISTSELVESFVVKADADLKSKGLNAALSHNEKKYQGMKYTVRMVKI